MDIVVDIIGYIFHLLGAILYDPVYWLYEMLPFSESISAWREEFISAYFDVYLKPIIMGIALNIAIEGVCGVVFGSIINFLGDMIAVSQFCGSLTTGLVFLVKGVLGAPIFLVVLLAPFILPPIIMYSFLGAILAVMFSKK